MQKKVAESVDPKNEAVAENGDWPGWRGANRDGLVKWLPERLPGPEAILWSKRLSSPALAGVAANRDAIIVADRDPADRADIFRCFNADGSERWTLRYLAPGNLDYGNSSRSTPLIHGDLVYLQGAHGHFHAVDLMTGKIRWKTHFQRDFGGPAKQSWGYCSSPLIVDGRLIINPGGADASLVALDPATGEVQWQTPGREPGHGSFVVAMLGGKRQLIGYDVETLGGWDVATGQRLWTLTAERPGDFNVPTPIIWGQKILVSTENNGTRLYGTDTQGVIMPQPEAKNKNLVPDCHSPILVGTRIFGVSDHLFCLDASQQLSEIWRLNDRQFREYASLIGSPDKILATTLRGRLLLFSATGPEFNKLSDVQILEDEAGLYSHPAIVGTRLYIRGSGALICLDLEPATKP